MSGVYPHLPQGRYAGVRHTGRFERLRADIVSRVQPTTKGLLEGRNSCCGRLSHGSPVRSRSARPRGPGCPRRDRRDRRCAVPVPRGTSVCRPEHPGCPGPLRSRPDRSPRHSLRLFSGNRSAVSSVCRGGRPCPQRGTGAGHPRSPDRPAPAPGQRVAPVRSGLLSRALWRPHRLRRPL